MVELLLAAALGGTPLTTSWPSDCDKLGDAYFQAATIRDSGQRAGVIAELSPEQVEKVQSQVHQRRDMTPEQWKWFAIGVCAAEATSVKVSAFGNGFAAFLGSPHPQ